jgi:hypothetical protein
MGTQRHHQRRQEQPWVTRTELAAPGHPFYRSLNELLDGEGFDESWINGVVHAAQVRRRIPIDWRNMCERRARESDIGTAASMFSSDLCWQKRQEYRAFVRQTNPGWVMKPHRRARLTL